MSQMEVDIQKIQSSIIRWRYTSIRSETGNLPGLINYIGFIDIERKPGYTPIRGEIYFNKEQYEEAYNREDWNAWHDGPLPDWVFDQA